MLPLHKKRLSIFILYCAITLVLAWIESLILSEINLLGLNLGLVLFSVFSVLYQFGIKEAILMSLVAIVLPPYLFHLPQWMHPTFYGMLFSLPVMYGIYSIILYGMHLVTRDTTALWGCITYNIGQLLYLYFTIDLSSLPYPFIYLLIAGIVEALILSKIIFVAHYNISRMTLLSEVLEDINRDEKRKAQTKTGLNKVEPEKRRLYKR